MRFAQLGDIPELKRLWIQAFGEEAGFMERFFQERMNCTNTLILENSCGKIVSMLYLLPCKLSIPDVKEEYLSAVNIVGVATDENERHKGYMSILFKECFEVLKERKIAVAVLKPSNTAFYEQFGFEKCTVLHEASLKDIYNIKDNAKTEIYQNVTDELIKKLDNIYINYKCGGYKLLRSYEDWKFNLQGNTVVLWDNAYAVCTESQGELLAYEVIPREELYKKGKEVGCTMIKDICEDWAVKAVNIYMNERIDEEMGNCILEQY